MRTELENLKVQLLQKREILRCFFSAGASVFIHRHLFICLKDCVSCPGCNKDRQELTLQHF